MPLRLTGLAMVLVAVSPSIGVLTSEGGIEVIHTISLVLSLVVGAVAVYLVKRAG